MRRFWQVSLTSCSVRCTPSVVKVYLPGSAQAGFGAFVSTSSRLEPAVFHVPIIVGQPCPAIENVPSARNCPGESRRRSGAVRNGRGLLRLAGPPARNEAIPEASARPTIDEKFDGQSVQGMAIDRIRWEVGTTRSTRWQAATGGVWRLCQETRRAAPGGRSPRGAAVRLPPRTRACFVSIALVHVNQSRSDIVPYGGRRASA